MGTFCSWGFLPAGQAASTHQLIDNSQPSRLLPYGGKNFVKHLQLCSTRLGTVIECLLWVPFTLHFCSLGQGPLVISVARAQRGGDSCSGQAVLQQREAMVDVGAAGCWGQQLRCPPALFSHGYGMGYSAERGYPGPRHPHHNLPEQHLTLR